MQFAARSRAEVLADARQQYRDAMGPARAAGIQNADALLDRDAAQLFVWRGVQFRAVPTTVEDGVALLRWQRDVSELDGRGDDESLERYLALQHGLRERFRRMARPVRLRDRVLFWGRNPFGAATEGELAVLVGFFSAYRMMSRVRYAGMN